MFPHPSGPPPARAGQAAEAVEAVAEETQAVGLSQAPQRPPERQRVDVVEVLDTSGAWRRSTGGGAPEEEHWRRSTGGGAPEVERRRRSAGGGALEEEHWRRSTGGGALEEAAGCRAGEGRER